jgi:hypothetical protein
MTRFYNISTTEFRPISFENVYLYGEYKKIKNFLISNNQQELLKVLAIPSYKNNNIEWSANTNNEIRKLDEYSKNQKNKILSQYNEFLNSYNRFVNNLKSSKNQDNKNWGELLFSLIEGTANELFFDGENIFITWGWRLLDENSKKLIPVYSPPPPIVEDATLVVEEGTGDPEPIPIINESKKVPFDKEEKLSWLDRFYLFLKKLWWLVPIFSIIILILVLLKACENNECDSVCSNLDDELNNIDILLDNCDCKEILVRGCLDSNYQEYDPDANFHDLSLCLTDLRVYGCMDKTYETYNPDADVNVQEDCKRKLHPCDEEQVSGGDGITTTKHFLGENSGTVTIYYGMDTEPDKLEVFYEGKLICSTYSIPNNDNGFVGDGNAAGCCGSLSFFYHATGDRYCTVVLTGGDGTSWHYTLGCPK